MSTKYRLQSRAFTRAKDASTAPCAGYRESFRRSSIRRAGAGNYVGIAYDAAEVLWLAARTEHIETIERNLREKVVEPDFRAPMTDGRLALGRLCALQHRYEEAVEWFAKSRAVLDEQGARPLRAIVDYDEALMYVRRGEAGDDKRAAPLLEAALMQFRTLGMPGWIRRAESLLHDGQEWVPSTQVRGEALPDQPSPAPLLGKAGEHQPEIKDPTADTPTPTPQCVFRREGHYWTVAYAEQVVRLKDSRGLRYLAHLLRHPGQEILAIDLAQSTENDDLGVGDGRPDFRTDTCSLVPDPGIGRASQSRLQAAARSVARRAERGGSEQRHRPS